jgi:hypothetical protein
VTRRDYRSRWVWELLAQDRHVLNRSDSNFVSKEECEADALKNGQTLEPAVIKPRRREKDVQY